MSEVDRLLGEASTPLIKALDGVEAEIEGHEIRLKELREDRLKLTTVLRRIAPESVPSAPKREKPSRAGDRPSQAVMDKLIEALLTHRQELNGNGGFHVTGLMRDYEWAREIGNQSTVTRAVQHLRDEGFLVLDHSGTGGSKYYKVVS